MKCYSLFSSVVIGALAMILFVPFLGQTHLFDWDEINFAECAREMLITGNYSIPQINYETFWEKPPLFIWMQAFSMHLFGINEWAARLPNALCGVITLVVLWNLGRRIYDERFAGFWVIAYAGSLLPHFYFRSGIIDPWFNLFILLGIYQFILYTNSTDASRRHLWNRSILFSALFIGLAVLTKGPVALLIFGLCFIVYRLLKKSTIMTWTHFGIYAAVIGIVAGSWFAVLAITGQGHLVMEFLIYQIRLFSTEDAGHGGSFFYHWIILLLGCFPASVFALSAFLRNTNDTPWEKHVLRWMRILFWVVLILFSIVKTKIVHYSSLCYFPLTYLAAYAIYKMSMAQFGIKRSLLWFIIGIGGALSLVLMVIPLIDRIKINLINSGAIHDSFAAANLQANGNWNGWESFSGLILLVGIVTCCIILRRRFRYSMYWLFGGTLIATSLASLLIAPRVGLYSQAAVVQFWQSKANQSVYLETLFYKSYAHYFYGNVQPGLKQNPSYTSWRKNQPSTPSPGKSRSEYETDLQREWMLIGLIDRPAYFSCKINREDEVRLYYPQLKRIGAKNGFVFWERLPENSIRNF